MKKIIFIVLIILSILNTYFYNVLTAQGASQQTDSNPVYTRVVGQSQNFSNSIAACEFYRGNWNPQAQKYQSPTLIGYFEEASKISGVPASVLAAITRIENPTLTTYTDQSLSSWSCPESADGALGPMQIVSPASDKMNPNAVCPSCIEVGAKLLGKTSDQLTREDFCGLRSGIILGAGFILKKMQLSYGLSAPTWDPAWTTDKDALANKLAHDYYGGSLEYGGGFNYGEDIWNSVSNCKPTNPSGGGSTPMATLAKDLVKAFAQNCGGDISIPLTNSINRGNYTCIQKGIPSSATYPDLTFGEIARSALTYTYLQCVGFIQSVASGINGSRINSPGNAKDFAYTNPEGYKWISNTGIVEPGDIAVFTGGPYGHIVVVSEVYDQERGIIQLAEANYNLNGGVRFRNATKGEVAGWLHKQ